MTKAEYNTNLGENISKLVDRLKNESYKSLSVKRVYTKGKRKEKTARHSSIWNKIVQLGLKKIFESVYESKFKGNMYGFRPKKNCHMAIEEMCSSKLFVFRWHWITKSKLLNRNKSANKFAKIEIICKRYWLCHSKYDIIEFIAITLFLDWFLIVCCNSIIQQKGVLLYFLYKNI